MDEKTTPLPRRVLDVSPPQGLLKLHKTTENEFGQYICPSRHWGSSRPLVTTRDNLGRMKEPIPWESIPQTFKGAITVTRNVNYLHQHLPHVFGNTMLPDFTITVSGIDQGGDPITVAVRKEVPHLDNIYNGYALAHLLAQSGLR
ncbi:hypothetical protein QBC44DRAFT_307373 [Cladorrhinum sp. PSN332]|nr:hypothetical protein QBC44DRAFT_307373 [Cladorrhinum sp. PSN332]